MAGEVRKKALAAVVFAMISVVCVASLILIIPSAVPTRVLPMTVSSPNTISATLPFRGPQNIEFVRDGDSLRISWDAVPGATGYNVYTCESLRDTTIYVPYAMWNFEKSCFVYEYSFHPRYGDCYVYATQDDPYPEPLMWKGITISPWEKITAQPIIRTNWAVPKAEVPSVSNFYYVTAVR